MDNSNEKFGNIREQNEELHDDDYDNDDEIPNNDDYNERLGRGKNIMKPSSNYRREFFRYRRGDPKKVFLQFVT